MKHCENDLAGRLVLLCAEAEVPVSLDAALQMVEYLLAIIEVNRRINLTRIETADSGIRLHLLDSLTILPEILSASAGALCDIGSGGGFPGVPIGIATSRSCTLLDSVGKKATTVNEIMRSLNIPCCIRAVPERAEYHGRAHRGAYSVVTARAVAPLPSLLELAAPLLALNGRLIALKGALTEEELVAGDKVAKMVGLKREDLRRLLLPDGGERRAVVSYTKIGSSRITLPRREGLAQHSPLA